MTSGDSVDLSDRAAVSEPRLPLPPDRLNIVTTEGLTKRYGDFTALSGCTIAVRRGEIFGLLGPNGAGKSTLIRLLMGHLQPTSGDLSINGLDPRTDGVGVRSHVAYLPGDARLPRHMRGLSVLKFFSDMHPSGSFDRSLAVAERLELDTKTRVAFMSTGMRQKLALAVVFGVQCDLLILDEPTANLDPTIRAIVLELAMEARQAGRTVMFSSHVLSEIEETCDRVAFLRKGQLAHKLTMSDLFQRHRITAQIASDGLAAQRYVDSVDFPADIADRVRISVLRRGPSELVCIDTDGDLAGVLSWVDSLKLKQIRIEPLGLRAVYDDVHSGRIEPTEKDSSSNEQNSGDDA